MKTEYEATFADIDKNEIRKRLEAAGAKFIRPEFLQKRAVFNFPEGHEVKGGWARVRDEGDKITVSAKIVSGAKIEDQKEIYFEVSDFESAKEFLKLVGLREKAYQESKREFWKMDGADITIDEWPFLEPFIEIEGEEETSVKNAAEKLGFNWSDAFFGAVDTLYGKKYGLPEDVINNQTPLIVFDMENPFINRHFEYHRNEPKIGLQNEND